ncbi:hypothetical protein RUM44_008924 [Polyplax serrata]|uniref:Isopropylmalate dehydrogenase-like domain-containing protein n=1 Tax=Polyplax serrata TaxID=468196 RepID=A0ABR1ARV3_POLSC
MYPRLFAYVRLISTWSSRYVSDIDPLPTRYGGKRNVTVLPGSGVGPELMDCTLQILKAAGAPLSYETVTLSSVNGSDEEFQNVLTSIRRNRVAIKVKNFFLNLYEIVQMSLDTYVLLQGNIEIQSKNPYVSSRNILLRKTLDLFVYILPCKTYRGLENKFGDIDITVIRQNTEGEYLMLEHEPTPGSVESLKIVTRYNSERIAEFAFNYAVKYNRKQITVVHNADIQVLTEGVFVNAALSMSKRFPKIKVNVLEVSGAVVKLSRNPKLFDIILATNLNGSMISNYIIGMLGGAGLTSGVNCSDTDIAVFEPGSRSKGSSLVGKGIANPVPMILAGVSNSHPSNRTVKKDTQNHSFDYSDCTFQINLLNYLGYHRTAVIIENSVFATLEVDKIRTQDIGGTATSQEVTDRVISHIRTYFKSRSVRKSDEKPSNRWKTYCDAPAKTFSEEEIPPKQ